MIKQFDVFLAHNSQDKSQVQEIANKLKEKGLVPCLDKEQILGGDSIPQKVTSGLERSKAAIFFIGSQGLGKFQETWELDTLIMLCSQQKIPIIPVLLPGVSQLPPCLLIFTGKKWIQFKSNISEVAPLDLLIRSISAHVNRPIFVESTEETQRQLGTNELLQNLADPDPLVCFAAARILRGRSDLGEELIDISASSRVAEKAVRMVLESFPEKSAELLVTAIRDCGTTGESWFRASRASRYCSPSHSSFAEGLLVDFLTQGSGHIERLRHVLMALGRIGRLAFYTSEINDLFINNIGREFISYNDDRIQKCFSYALEGAAWNFVLASDLSIGTASRSFLNLMDLGEKTRRQSASVPLGLCSLRHVDEILTTWLDADSPCVKRLGLIVLSKLRVARSAKKILQIFQHHRDDNIAETAARALWCIGEPNSIKALMNLGTSVLAGQGLLHVDEDSFYRWLPRILESNYAWLAYRAIGLRKRKDKISLLQDGLFHTNPVHRGSAALALARLGEHSGLKKAYEESDNVDERIFTALAVLSADHRRASVAFREI